MAAKTSYVFTSDSDPELTGKALPFTIKLCESLLQARPKDHKLLEMTGSLFVMYANAFVQWPAEQFPQEMFKERKAEMERAGKLYLRGLNYLYRRLELKYPGFSATFKAEETELIRPLSEKILAKMKKDDVSSLYWAAIAGISAYSLNPFNPALSIRVNEFLALVNRAYLLDPDFNNGAIDEFFFLFYASMPKMMGGDMEKAEFHYQKALEKSEGNLVSPYVSYAKAVSIPAQDYDTFKTCLEKALSIDIDANPSTRLVNMISKQKAQYLLDSAERLFIFYGEDDNEYDY